MGKIRRAIQHYREHLMLSRKSYRVYVILRFLVILTAIRSILLGNYESFALCILSLLLFLLPAIFEEKLKVDIPPAFEIIIFLFIYAAEILGEVNKFYTAIPGWDTMLHTMNGFLCAAIGFSLIDLLNRNNTKINLSPAYLTLVAFCFSMTVGVVWEFFEFSADYFFGLDMQKDFIVKSIASVTLDPTQSQTVIKVQDIARTVIETAGGQSVIVDGGYLDIGILDTMKDLLVNFVGAVVFSVFGYLYVSSRDGKHQNNIARRLKLRAMSDKEVEEQQKEIKKLEGMKKNRRRKESLR